MEPLERRILYFRKVSASTPQRPFTIATASLLKMSLNCAFKYPKCPIVGHLQKNCWTSWPKTSTQKETGRRFFNPRPARHVVKNNCCQLPQSRAVSLVMVQLAPSEQLTTW
jgi:hypothetical protein